MNEKKFWIGIIALFVLPIYYAPDVLALILMITGIWLCAAVYIIVTATEQLQRSIIKCFLILMAALAAATSIYSRKSIIAETVSIAEWFIITLISTF